MAEHTPDRSDAGQGPAGQLARGDLVEAEVRPLDLSGISAVAAGTAAWAVALVVMLLFFRDDLERRDAEWWLWVPATGLALGLLGLVYCRRRWSAIRRARDAEGGPGGTARTQAPGPASGPLDESSATGSTS